MIEAQPGLPAFRNIIHQEAVTKVYSINATKKPIFISVLIFLKILFCLIPKDSLKIIDEVWFCNFLEDDVSPNNQCFK